MDAILDIPLPYRLAGLAAIGVCIGAVLNWAIYRLSPAARPISPWSDPSPQAKPGSWFDLVPVFGWLLLRRDSGLHGRGFWVRPMLLELAVGGIYAGLYWWEVVKLGLISGLVVPLPPPPITMPGADLLLAVHMNYLSHVVLMSFMIAATFIDIDEWTIPDSITLPGTLVGLWMAAIVPNSLLIEQVRRMAVGGEVVDTLHLASPNEWPRALNGILGNWPLMIGLGCFLLWCFALLPRTWRMRRGLDTAVTLFLGHIVREPFSWLVGAMALAGSFAIWGIYRLGPPYWVGLLSALVGLAGSALLVWSVRIIGTAVLKREAMGFGDVTLMAMIGAFLGWQAGVLVFFLAPFVALVFGLVQLVIRRHEAIPYGPFLCVAAAGLIVGWSPAWTRVSPIFANGWIVPGVLAACMVLLAVLLALVEGAKGLFTEENEAPGNSEAQPPA